MIDRRRFLRGTALMGAGLASARLRAAPRLPGSPFTLGVAAGYPAPDGIALWTRLAPLPLAPGGGMEPVPVAVRWEIGEDERFGTLADHGVEYATPAGAHAVHVESARLRPDRVYWYRFHADDATSPVGRFRTAPAPAAEVARLRFAFVSCQQYEQGWYAAYRHLVADTPDLLLHLGDYIYESSWGDQRVRRHEGPEPVTLEQYRARHACYRLDPDLQAAHAACAWLCGWDDHEVDNDYANDLSQDADLRRWFRARRAAAYRAYYEHMPLRRNMTPLGPDLRLHARVPWGRLAAFTMLDTRQYKSPQPCPQPGRAGSNVIENCAARENPAATMLGARQERWLAAGLAGGGARWNLLGQTTLMAQADSKSGPGQAFYSDAWDGYPAARQRLLQTLLDTRAANPVLLGGDVHSFWVTDLKTDFERADSPTVASEFVTTSVTSQPPPEERIRAAASEGAHVKFATGLHRGYVRMDLAPGRLTADLRALDDARRQDARCSTLSTWVVEDGRPGAQRA
jgi:alkaline phosphatase D